jgi:hypothetical protein
VSDINYLYTTIFPSLGVVFSVNSTGYVYVSATNATVFPTNIIIQPTNLSKMLGFRSGLDILATRYVESVVPYRLSIDDYANLYFPQFSSTTLNSNQIPCSFKIPLNTTNNVVYFRDTQDTILNVNPTLRFSYLDFCIYDRLGYSLNSMGLDWSLSLIFEY